MLLPVPDYIKIKRSSVQGYGIFAARALSEGFDIGCIRRTLFGQFSRPEPVNGVINESGRLAYFPTVVGGLGNHSLTPNCETFFERFTMLNGVLWVADIHVRTLATIYPGDELLWTYSLYDPESG